MPDSRFDSGSNSPFNRNPTRMPTPPNDWREAFAALALEDAPAGGWARVLAALDVASPRRPMPRLWPFATAAGVLLAISTGWQLRPNAELADKANPATTPTIASASKSPAASELETLYAESARLETLVGYARDPRMGSGTAIALSVEFEGRIASIDAALMQSGLTTQRQTALWRDRVTALRTLAGFESTRRWLAANGDHYDGALARVD